MHNRLRTHRVIRVVKHGDNRSLAQRQTLRLESARIA